MKLLTLLLLPLLLLACNTAPEADSAMEEGMEEQMDTDNPEATLRATNSAIETNSGDITAIPGTAAVANIDTWMEQLDGVDGANKVTGNLETLREALNEQPINGQLAGMLLITLAEDAQQVAGSTAGISTLVSALKAGGEKLIGTAFDGSSVLEQTLQAVKGKMGDITTLPVDAAIENIDAWIPEVRGLDGGEEMAENLTTLRAELTADNIDGERVSELLFDMSESTREMAGDSKALAVLAYALEAGGYRLDGE